MTLSTDPTASPGTSDLGAGSPAATDLAATHPVATDLPATRLAATHPPASRPLHRLRQAISEVVLVLSPLWIFPLNRKRMRFFQAVGDSMRPALEPGDEIVALPLDRAPIERGAIVAFSDGWHAEYEFAFKRIIALPGEEIEIRAHQVIVDGQVLAEPYAIPPTHGRVPPRRLGPDECFVMGDNRSNSCDSRTHGPLPVDWIVGRAIFRKGPSERAGPLRT